MKIISLDTVTVDFYRTNLILLRLETDEGLIGVAEATLEGQEFAVQGAVRILEQAVLGKDPTRITQLIHEVARDGFATRWEATSSCSSKVTVASTYRPRSGSPAASNASNPSSSRSPVPPKSSTR
jgi:galactonate dehydratase